MSQADGKVTFELKMPNTCYFGLSLGSGGMWDTDILYFQGIGDKSVAKDMQAVGNWAPLFDKQ